ncbi:MAG TPA: choice-of-anchor B family protein [Gemmatimonadales bacterium]
MPRSRTRCFVPVALILAAGPGSLQAQTFVHSITAAPAVSGFGSAVAVGEADVLVAEPFNARTAGMVFVYRKGEDGWAEVLRLTASDATSGDQFGRAIALDGSYLLVGAPAAGGARGAAYVFQRSRSGEWTQVARLAPEGAAAGGRFGAAVAITGDVVMVAAGGSSESPGVVYVFERDGTRWAPQGTLGPMEAEADDGFGAAIALGAEVAVIGAPRRTGRAGAAFVFRRGAGAARWTEEAMLLGGDGEANAQFGSAVSLDGPAVVVGAPFADGSVGAVFTFARDVEDGTWSVNDRLVPFDGARQNRFGAAIAAADDALWIGAPGASGFQGRVYQVRRGAADGWAGVGKLGAEGLARGDAFAGAVAVRGTVAVVGVVRADYGEGTAMIFERRDGRWQAVATVLSEVGNYAPIVGGQIDCASGVAAQFDCDGMNLVAFMPVSAIGGARGVRVNDIWGWTDPATGREYALVGRVNGTSFVDVTEPADPQYLGDLPKTEGAPGSTWRDIKVYRDHAFIVADGAGEHGMQVFDLTRLRGVTAPVTFTETAHYDRIHSAHNIVINEQTGFAYAVGSSAGGETCGGGLHMIDLRQPDRPTFAGCFADSETGRRGTGYSHDAQCVAYHGPDTEHAGKEICFGANETALSIADVTDKDAPVALSRASYPNVAYTHQGWLTEDQHYFYMNDELDELRSDLAGTRTLVWDVTDLDDPVLVKEHFGTEKATDHNLYIRGNLMYQSNYVSGLRVLDISDAENPVEVGFFDTVPYGDNGAGFGGSWSNYPFFTSGIVIVTSGREGLFIVKQRELVP